VVDFRGAHERILDGIRERAKKFGSADDRSSLPTLDVATLFPVREPKAADVRRILSLHSFAFFLIYYHFNLSSNI
jgi:hypothetical protein